MRMKKTLAALAALAMLGSLSACGGSSSSTSESSPAETAAPTTTAAPETTEAPATTTTAPVVLDVDENAITFEDGRLYTAHQMGGGGDEADIELDIAEYKGDKKLRVHVLKADDAKEYGVPKLVFDLPKLIGVENTGNIGHISIDFTCVALEPWLNEDGTESLVVGNFLGAIAGNIASEKGYDADNNLIQDTWATHLEFAFDDWENAEHTWRAETDVPALLPKNGYAANDPGTSLVIMRWGQSNSVDFYLDNITFYDKDGKSMPIVWDGTEGTPADEGGEAAEQTATSVAPAAETTTAAAGTTTAAAETTTKAAG